MSHCVKRVPQLGHNNRGHTYHLRRSGSCAWRALLRRSCMGALLTPEVNSFSISFLGLQAMASLAYLDVCRSDMQASASLKH